MEREREKGGGRGGGIERKIERERLREKGGDGWRYQVDGEG